MKSGAGCARQEAMSPQPDALQRISRLTPLPDLLDKVAGLEPVAAKETETRAAAGHTLAADAAAAATVPAQAMALRDGWAVNAAAVSDAGPYAPVALTSHAWVEAGAPMPMGMDAILPVDAVSVSASGAEALAPATAGDGVLAAGGDAVKGQVLRRAGEILRASDVAALLAAGVAKVSARHPRVNLFPVKVAARSAGDTLTPLLARAVEGAGGEAVITQAASLESALLDKSADLVVSVGGTGCGKNDGAVKTLARVGQVNVHGFGIAPGETAALGHANGRAVLMLPGRLDAALAAFLLIGVPLIARLAGRSAEQNFTSVKLAKKISSSPGLAEMIPVRRVSDGVEPLAAGFLPAAALAAADGWVLMPPQSEGFAAGSVVEMRPLP